MKPETTDVSVGYLIFSSLFIMIAALAFQELNYIVFFIPLAVSFALASSRDRGGTNKNLASIGWTDNNTSMSIPYGIFGGLVAVIIGSMVVGVIPGSIIPDFSTLGKLVTASVIPPTIAVGFNIISQWLIVAPSEETLSKILSPYAGNLIFKSAPVAIIISALLWMGMHYPTFKLQGVSSSMYIVLAILYGITLLLFYITGSVLSAIVAHGTFNSVVLVTSSQSNPFAYYILFGIGLIMAVVWWKSKNKGRATT